MSILKIQSKTNYDCEKYISDCNGILRCWFRVGHYETTKQNCEYEKIKGIQIQLPLGKHNEPVQYLKLPCRHI